MTFADVPINEPFKDGGTTFVKLTEATADRPGTAQGPKFTWRASSIFTFEPDDEVEEWTRWRLP